jgi:hypothetical protein
VLQLTEKRFQPVYDPTIDVEPDVFGTRIRGGARNGSSLVLIQV